MFNLGASNNKSMIAAKSPNYSQSASVKQGHLGMKSTYNTKSKNIKENETLAGVGLIGEEQPTKIGGPQSTSSYLEG